jgi:hypothetical protein
VLLLLLERRIIMKNSIYYTLTAKMTDMDLNRLGNQVRVLVETIQFLQVEGKVERDEVYKLWLSDTGKTDNEKVYASYIHDLIQYGFLDKVGDAKKVIEPKAEIARLMRSMSNEQRAEILKALAQVD